MFTQAAEHDIARATQDARFADEAGFALPPTVVPFGTLVIEEGQGRYRESRRTWEDMPLAGALMRNVIEDIRAEHRRDRVLPVSSLKMCAEGKIGCGPGVPTYAARPTKWAFRQLCNFAPKGQRIMPAGAFTYLSDSPLCDLGHRVVECNHWWGQAPEEAQVMLRLRGENGHEIYAAVGPKFSTEADLDKVAGILAQRQWDTGRGKCVREGAAWELDVLWHSALNRGESVVAGEVFQAGVRVRSADDGSQGPTVEAVLWRNLCLNFIIIGEAKAAEARTTHHRQSMAAWLQERIAAAQTAVQGFAGRWNEAYRTRLLGQDWGAPSDAFEALIKAGLLSPPEGSGLKTEEYVERLVSAYHAEQARSPYGYLSVADAVNAVSRAAHEGSWSSPWATSDQEAQAGALCQEVRVWRA